MSEDQNLRNRWADLPISPFFFAALFAGVVVGIGMFVYYGSLGPIAGLVAFGSAFFYALILAPIFYFARRILREVTYFLLHLAVGVGIGAIRAAPNPYVSTWQHLVLNHDALLVTCASLAAWLCVFVFSNPRNTSSPTLSRWKQSMAAPAMIFGLVVLPIPITLVPVPADPSCHNQFRGGRTSVSPSVSFDIRLGDPGDEELDAFRAEVSELYDDFAAEFDMSIRRHPLLPESTSRSICNDDIVISAGGTFAPGRHHVGVYEHIGASDWEPLASELVCRLEARWPGFVVFTGRGGEDIPKPTILVKNCPAIPV